MSSEIRRSAATQLEKELLDLQWAQLEHDELYHKDIVILPAAERMKHFALHFSKYVGYFAESIDSGDSTRFQQTLVDALIITLAFANTLNLDLGRALTQDATELPDTLEAVGSAIAGQSHLESDAISFLKQVARHSGHLAKACESLDHVESYPFREVMLSSVLQLFKLFVAEGSVLQVKLADKVKARLKTIEPKNIFYSRLAASRTKD